MARIVIPDDEPSVMIPSAAFRKLDGRDVRAYDTRPDTARELINRIGGAEIVINIRSSCRFDRQVLDSCPSLRLISIWGTGVDNVDLDVARDHDVAVTNTPAVAKDTVAEHTLMLMLAAGRRILEVDRSVRDGLWPRATIAPAERENSRPDRSRSYRPEGCRVGEGDWHECHRMDIPPLR